MHGRDCWLPSPALVMSDTMSRGKSILAIATVVLVVGTACNSSPEAHPTSSGRVSPIPTPPPSALTALERPLLLGTIPGAPCPNSPGREVNGGDFAGIALGPGPVSPIPGGGSVADRLRGVVTASPIKVDGWYGDKTLWFSAPSYSGPFLIRGRRLDGAGMVAFGEKPILRQIFVEAGPTRLMSNGYRLVAGGTYFESSGCYAWQVDTDLGSYTIVATIKIA